MQRTSSPIRTFLRAVGVTVSVAVASTTIGAVVTAAPAAAVVKQCDPTEDPSCGFDPPDDDTPIPYKPASTDLGYKLVDRVDGWKQAWRSRDDTQWKNWPVETYDPRYVHPTSFDAKFFNQCVDQTDWDKEINYGALTVNTYKWTVAGVVKTFRACFSTLLQLPGEGIHDVRLDVVSPSGTTLVTKQGKAKAEDHLIVLFGDSMASGEGSPEKERKPKDEFGTWIDRRCHRSSWAAVPRAAAALEASDPHSTVTFLDFACSGATIGRWVPGEGSGILDRYNGIEPPIEYTAEEEEANPGVVTRYLPSQVDQLEHALRSTKAWGSGPPARSVDKLFVSAGLNDVAFADMTKVCVLYTQCSNLTSPMYGGWNSVHNVFHDLAADIPGYYEDLDAQLAERDIVTAPGGRMIMEYPDPFTNTDKSLCTTMLNDVLPWTTVDFIVNVVVATIVALYAGIVTAPLAAILSALLATAVTVLEFALGVPDIWSVLGNAYVGELRLAADEIAWMKNTGMPHLKSKLQEGAADGGFAFVAGIGKLFEGHGYCASDNWVARARRSSFDQGPYDFISKPLGLNVSEGIAFGLDVHLRTKGTIHPNRKGYQAVADHLAAQLGDLIDHRPTAVADAFDLDLAAKSALDTGAPGVLANDTDEDGDAITAQLLTGPANGTATLGADGRLQYTPKAGFEGWDTLTYRASDGGLVSPATTVSIHVYDSVGPDWQWAIPAELTVASTSTLRFPVCTQCGHLIVRVNPGPPFGKVVFDRVEADWFATYTPPVAADWTLPATEHLVIEIGRSLDVGHFEQLGAREVAIQVTGTRSPIVEQGPITTAP